MERYRSGEFLGKRILEGVSWDFVPMRDFGRRLLDGINMAQGYS